MTRDELMRIDREESDGGGMMLFIPTVVQRDQELPLSARMLYGIISWKCNENGRCWPSNRVLGEELGKSAKRVSELISLLEQRGHIETEVVRDEESGEILRRYIYPLVKSGRGILSPQRGDVGGIPKNKDTLPENGGGPPPKNQERNNKLKEESNIPPKSPQRGKRRREIKTAPDWNPERFGKLWEFYPNGRAKQNAIQAWDKLQPSDELIDTMAQALKRQVASESWQQGIGIPYLSTWLNQQRWTDELDRRAPAAPERESAAEIGGYWL